MNVLAPALYRFSELWLARDISTKLRALSDHSKLDAEARARRHKSSIIQTVKQASVEVPHYRDLFRKIAFNPDKLEQDFSYFEDIPYLSKEIIQSDPSRLLNERLAGLPRHERKTGGSTGITLTVYYSNDALDWTAAANRWVIEATGRGLTQKEVHLSSRMSWDNIPWKDRAREQVKCLALNRSNVYTEDFSSDGLDRLLSDLEKSGAYIIQGHPSTLYILGLHLKNQGKKSGFRFNAFESTGESIDREKASLIETTFGCKVYNRFGNAEFGVVAHSKDSIDRLEVLDSMVYAENLIYGQGIPEIILTGLQNPLMPLIRYRTGDIGEISGTFGNQLILGVQGRVHDTIQKDGKTIPTHFIKDSLERIGGLDEFQVVQGKDSTLTVSLVVPDPARFPALAAKVHEILGTETTVKKATLNQLRRVGWRDKFRYLIKE